MASLLPQLLELPTQAILDALSEYQSLGDEAFLNRYHPYKPATVHFGYHGDLRFPPRAVLAAAYSKVHGRVPEPDGRVEVADSPIDIERK